MRRMMLLGALSAALVAAPALAEPRENRGWHDRERIESQVNRDHDRVNRDRDRRNRELDRRNRELDRAQNQFHRREPERDRKWHEQRRHHDQQRRHDQQRHHDQQRRHDYYRHDASRRYDFWARERAWHHHHHHAGHWDTGVRFYVFENRRYIYHPYFAESDPFVRDEHGNCYRVEYQGDSRILRQVRNKYCRWS